VSIAAVSVRWRRIAVFCAVVFLVTHAVTTAYRLRGGSWNIVLAALDVLLALVVRRHDGGGAPP